MSNINYIAPDFIQARFIEIENEQENDRQSFSQRCENLEEVLRATQAEILREQEAEKKAKESKTPNKDSSTSKH